MLYRKQQMPYLPFPQPQQEIFIPYGQMNIINDFRTLWGEIAIWVRQYIAATAAGYPNLQATHNRLYRIPISFQDKLKMVFGAQSAEGFQNLLSMHIILTERIIAAIKDGDSEMVNTITAELYRNADQMASYLRQINPFWNEVQWRNPLYNFIAMNLQQAVSFMAGDYERDIDVYDRLIYYSLLLGEYMANGIIQYLIVASIQRPST